MKSYYIFFILLLLAGCKTTQTTPVKAEIQPNEDKNEFLKLYGFQFDIPDTFVKVIDDVKTTDLKDNIRSRETAFKDSITGSELHVIFHPQPYGKPLYDYYHSLINENKANSTNIAGFPAVHYVEILHTDGKGFPLPVSIVRDKYFVLDDDNSCLELVVNKTSNQENIDDIFQKMINEIKKL